jgi:hypothetical protein
MSKHIGYLYNPNNYHPIDIYKGYNFPCFLFGFIWFFLKGMYGWGVLSIILSFPTWGIANIFIGIFANGEYQKFLLNKGYLNDEQMRILNDAYAEEK